MSTQNQLHTATLTWLLEPESPGVRYLALRDLLDRPASDSELRSARTAAYRDGPIAAVLNAMNSAGFWVKPGPGYTPKYQSTVWAVILLAELGARLEEDPRIARACDYLLENTLMEGKVFSATHTVSGSADCLQGNLVWALLELGVEPSRLEKAFDWTARTVTGEGIAPRDDRHAPVRYYAGKCGPTFACGANNNLPCAWGGVKVMLALGKWPGPLRTPLIDRAIQHGVDFLFSVDPADAAYPTGYSDKPSGNWWKFGFPMFYVADLLQIVEALSALGYAHDPRLERSWAIIQQKQDADGRWAMEYDYTGKTWVDFGPKKQPNKWVTLRALRALKALHAA